jgi:hypothetical protein
MTNSHIRRGAGFLALAGISFIFFIFWLGWLSHDHYYDPLVITVDYDCKQIVADPDPSIVPQHIIMQCIQLIQSAQQESQQERPLERQSPPKNSKGITT